MYKVAIVEDDPLAQEVLKDLIETHLSAYELCHSFSDVQEAIAVLSKESVDLLFLDMEIGDAHGFDVLRGLNQIDFEVIITTMHNSYMLEAIKHSAIDYLMKPIAVKALHEAVARFEQRLGKQKSQPSAVDSNLLRINKLVIPQQSGLILVDLHHIVRMASDGAYTKIFLSNGTVHLASKHLKSYEEKLSAHLFFRVHHSALINLMHVKHYVKGEGGHVVMSDGSAVDVSRRKKEQFITQLGV